jgi:hypothetical protein
VDSVCEGGRGGEMTFSENIEDWCDCVRQMLRHHAQAWQSVMDSTSSHTVLAGEQGFGPGEAPFGTVPSAMQRFFNAGTMDSTTTTTLMIGLLTMFFVLMMFMMNRNRNTNKEDESLVSKPVKGKDTDGNNGRRGGFDGDDLIS